ncbi:uncharacterized protein LOC141655584 [Silene latifolia]|uniref:uncharacterized protein LOC141655584 n=1 Tax=Silene latifolia TaxID=37657 RepID=UPI003D76B584
MLDLRTSINVIPYDIYEKLKLGPLKDTSAVIKLAERSSVYPKRVVENVMVGVGKLVSSAHFYVLDMKSESDEILILLGRLFLRTAGTKIDVQKDTSSNHDLSRCQKSPIPSKLSNVLEGSPPKDQKCAILWDRCEDVEASRGLER